MGQVIRVSLPGYNALTDTNPDHFALYSDEDWVLIKEYTRGTVSANSNGTIIFYNLNYVPTIFAFYSDGGVWKSLTGHYFDIDSEDLLPHIVIVQGALEGAIGFFGNSGTPTNFKYFICYDQQI